MSHPSQSSSSFPSLFHAALRDYENKTTRSLADHPLSKELEKCDSVDSIVAVLQGQARSVRQYRGDDGRIMNSVKSSVHVLYTLSKLSTSTVLGEGIGIPVPAAKAVFAAIGILLGAVKGVTASYDALLDLLESFENFLGRLEIYTRIPPNDAAALGDILVKIMVELLSALALATKQVKKGRFKIFLNKLLGENKIGGALQKLDRLTQDEVRTAAAQTLQMVHGLTQNKSVVLDDKKASPFTSKPVRNVTKSERNKFRRGIHKWLSPPDPFKNHKIACESKHDKTLTWWIQSSTYTKWKESGSSSLLWVYGKPGAGKTILCSSIITDILKMCERGQALLAFFYCDFREDQKKDLRGLVSSLLVQLCDQSDAYHAVLSDFYEAHNCGEKYASDAELLQCLSDMVNIPGQTASYLIIDALDECPETTGFPSPRDKVLKLVQDLVKSRVTNLQICVTSRPEADIKLALEHSSFHTVSLHSEEGQIHDIAEYVRSVVDTEYPFQRWKVMDRELVIDVITKNADGMFRWVFCQLVYLRSCIPGCIRRALDELPETLDETYARTLKEISERNWQYAHRLFQCVVAASRPLRVEELAEFLTFDFDTGSTPAFVVNWRPEDPAHTVLSACGSLLSIVDVEGSQVIQFSHYSVKEYLTSTRLAESKDPISRFHVSMTASHTMVAQACLSLLLHFDENITRDRLEKFPLTDYAAEYWDGHARFEEVSATIQAEMRRLFETGKHHISIWVWIYDPIDGRCILSERPSQVRATSLHYAASCGLRDVVKFLIVDRSEDVNARDSFGRTPLSVACQKGHLEVALVVLEHGADPNAQNNQNWTALHLASQSGHGVVAGALLEHGADPNAQQDDIWMPLHFASYNGHLDIARTLLERGADINAQEKDDWTALHFASQNGHMDVAQVLLKRGIDLNAQTKDKTTALHLASQSGHVNVARALLERGADPNTQEKDNWTALHFASQKGHMDIVRALLEHGADPNAQQSNNWTALHFASYNGYPDIAGMLLERGADINAQEKDDWTALHFASQNGHIDVARTFLERGIDLNAQTNEKKTALHVASQNGHVDVARALLEHGADPNTQETDNWTALHFASQKGHMDVARALLDYDADPNAQEKANWMALHFASQKGHMDIVQSLLEHGADPNPQQRDGWTALHFASYNGHPDVAGMLLERGADINAQEKDDWTALHFASQNGHMDVAQVLLKRGIDLNAQTNEKKTALHVASQNGHVDVARALLEHGADPKAQEKENCVALHLASQKGHVDVVQALLECGTDPNARQRNNWTALHFASQNGQVDVVRALLERGADPNAQEKDSWMALHFASQKGHMDIVRTLLEHGTDPNPQQRDGWTALLFASYNGHGDIARTLLEHGADPNAQENDDWTALHFASEHGHVDVGRALLERGVDLNAQTNEKKTALHLASRRGKLDIVRLLVEYGSDIHAPDNEGRTPFQRASEHQPPHRDVMKFLLAHGATDPTR